MFEQAINLINSKERNFNEGAELKTTIDKAKKVFSSLYPEKTIETVVDTNSVSIFEGKNEQVLFLYLKWLHVISCRIDLHMEYVNEFTPVQVDTMRYLREVLKGIEEEVVDAKIVFMMGQFVFKAGATVNSQRILKELKAYCRFYEYTATAEQASTAAKASETTDDSAGLTEIEADDGEKTTSSDAKSDSLNPVLTKAEPKKPVTALNTMSAKMPGRTPNKESEAAQGDPAVEKKLHDFFVGFFGNELGNFYLNKFKKEVRITGSQEQNEDKPQDPLGIVGALSQRCDYDPKTKCKEKLKAIFGDSSPLVNAVFDFVCKNVEECAEQIARQFLVASYGEVLKKERLEEKLLEEKLSHLVNLIFAIQSSGNDKRRVCEIFGIEEKQADSAANLSSTSPKVPLAAPPPPPPPPGKTASQSGSKAQPHSLREIARMPTKKKSKQIRVVQPEVSEQDLKNIIDRCESNICPAVPDLDCRLMFIVQFKGEMKSLCVDRIKSMYDGHECLKGIFLTRCIPAEKSAPTESKKWIQDAKTLMTKPESSDDDIRAYISQGYTQKEEEWELIESKLEDFLKIRFVFLQISVFQQRFDAELERGLDRFSDLNEEILNFICKCGLFYSVIPPSRYQSLQYRIGMFAGLSNALENDDKFDNLLARFQKYESREYELEQIIIAVKNVVSGLDEKQKKHFDERIDNYKSRHKEGDKLYIKPEFLEKLKFFRGQERLVSEKISLDAEVEKAITDHVMVNISVDDDLKDEFCKCKYWYDVEKIAGQLVEFISEKCDHLFLDHEEWDRDEQKALNVLREYFTQGLRLSFSQLIDEKRRREPETPKETINGIACSVWQKCWIPLGRVIDGKKQLLKKKPVNSIVDEKALDETKSFLGNFDPMKPVEKLGHSRSKSLAALPPSASQDKTGNIGQRMLKTTRRHRRTFTTIDSSSPQPMDGSLNSSFSLSSHVGQQGNPETQGNSLGVTLKPFSKSSLSPTPAVGQDTSSSAIGGEAASSASSADLTGRTNSPQGPEKTTGLLPKGRPSLGARELQASPPPPLPQAGSESPADDASPGCGVPTDTDPAAVKKPDASQVPPTPARQVVTRVISSSAKNTQNPDNGERANPLQGTEKKTRLVPKGRPLPQSTDGDGNPQDLPPPLPQRDLPKKGNGEKISPPPVPLGQPSGVVPGYDAQTSIVPAAIKKPDVSQVSSTPLQTPARSAVRQGTPGSTKKTPRLATGEGANPPQKLGTVPKGGPSPQPTPPPQKQFASTGRGRGNGPGFFGTGRGTPAANASQASLTPPTTPARPAAGRGAPGSAQKPQSPATRKRVNPPQKPGTVPEGGPSSQPTNGVRKPQTLSTTPQQPEVRQAAGVVASSPQVTEKKPGQAPQVGSSSQSTGGSVQRLASLLMQSPSDQSSHRPPPGGFCLFKPAPEPNPEGQQKGASPSDKPQ